MRTDYNKKAKKVAKDSTYLDESSYSKLDARVVGVVNCKMLNLRDKPCKSGAVIDVLEKGTRVIIDHIKNGWAYVSADKEDGYVMAEFIREV